MYKKGPDVMSKSERTRWRYKAQWKNQSALDVFGFMREATTSAPGLTTASPGKHGDHTHIPEHPLHSESPCTLP